jgi:hypothetical protein
MPVFFSLQNLEIIIWWAVVASVYYWGDISEREAREIWSRARTKITQFSGPFQCKVYGRLLHWPRGVSYFLCNLKELRSATRCRWCLWLHASRHHAFTSKLANGHWFICIELQSTCQLPHCIYPCPNLYWLGTKHYLTTWSAFVILSFSFSCSTQNQLMHWWLMFPA